MYIQKRKLNNSYTVYVIHETTKASRSCERDSWSSPVKLTSKMKLSERTMLSPLADKTLVKHKLYGVGEVINTDIYGYMSIAFASKTAKFIFPDAFKDGFLARA